MDTDLVADTSTVIAVIANEPEKPLLIAKSQGYDLIAPRSLYWEIGNAFSAMIKRGRITLEQAKAAIEIYEQISINLIDVDLKQTTQSLCLRRLYDCLRPKSKLPVINAGRRFGLRSKSGWRGSLGGELKCKHIWKHKKIYPFCLSERVKKAKFGLNERTDRYLF